MVYEVKLRELREQHGLSQRKVAERINVTPGAVAQWELGLSSPTTENLLALADLFGCPLDAIFGRDPTDRTSA